MAGRLLWLDVLRQQQKEGTLISCNCTGAALQSLMTLRNHAGGCSEEEAMEGVADSVAAMLEQKLPLHSFEQVE